MSTLQIHSIMYRFHPSVQYDSPYPIQKQIRQQIVDLWERYGLQERTVFDCPVKSVRQNPNGKWIINDDEAQHGLFDGIVVAVGVTGNPKMPGLPGRENFRGPIFHSSKIDEKEIKGKRVLVIGSGASGTEAVEAAVRVGASHINVLSRSDKWIIPRNVIIQTLLASNIFGQEAAFTWVPEWALRKFFYRDLHSLAPSRKGLYVDTPIANSELFDLIREGKVQWMRGDILSLEENGVRFVQRAQGVPKGGPGHEIIILGDVIIMATGYDRPPLSFLPERVFDAPYGPPNWYLQVFPPQYPSICATNSTYVNAIGTVGNYHIGIYTRFLLMFLIDPLTRPDETWMKTWIDLTRFLKGLAPTGALDFFTYGELFYWYVSVILVNPLRWKWIPFVFFGKGRALPTTIAQHEDLLRKQLSERRPKDPDPCNNGQISV